MCSKRAAGVIPRGFCIVPYFALREVLDYVNNLRAYALLRLCGLRAYVRRAAHMGMAVKRMVLGGLFGEHVEARAAQLPLTIIRFCPITSTQNSSAMLTNRNRFIVF